MIVRCPRKSWMPAWRLSKPDALNRRAPGSPKVQPFTFRPKQIRPPEADITSQNHLVSQVGRAVFERECRLIEALPFVILEVPDALVARVEELDLAHGIRG